MKYIMVLPVVVVGVVLVVALLVTGGVIDGKRGPEADTTEIKAWRVVDSTGGAVGHSTTVRTDALRELLYRRDVLMPGECAWLEVTTDTGKTWRPETVAGCNWWTLARQRTEETIREIKSGVPDENVGR